MFSLKVRIGTLAKNVCQNVRHIIFYNICYLQCIKPNYDNVFKIVYAFSEKKWEIRLRN